MFVKKKEEEKIEIFFRILNNKFKFCFFKCCVNLFSIYFLIFFLTSKRLSRDMYIKMRWKFSFCIILQILIAIAETNRQRKFKQIFNHILIFIHIKGDVFYILYAMRSVGVYLPIYYMMKRWYVCYK